MDWRQWSLLGMECRCWEAEERGTWDSAVQGPRGERTPTAVQPEAESASRRIRSAHRGEENLVKKGEWFLQQRQPGQCAIKLVILGKWDSSVRDPLLQRAGARHRNGDFMKSCTIDGSKEELLNDSLIMAIIWFSKLRDSMLWHVKSHFLKIPHRTL